MCCLTRLRAHNYFEIRIRSEHAIGLLKGRFQALRELRAQISSTKSHKRAIIFIRSCIILHNLILRLEGGTFDAGFREWLVSSGTQNLQDMADGDSDEPRVGQRRAETEGQRFRRRLMTLLFTSESSGAVRRS